MRKCLTSILLGKQGLRSGWGILIFACILAAQGGLAKLAFRHMKPPHQPLPPHVLLTSELLTTAFVIIATFVLKRIEKRPWRFYGLGGGHIASWLALGWSAGIITILAGTMVLYAAGLLSVDGLALHGSAIATYGAAWFVCFLLTGAFEETLFRGYPQATLARNFGFWPTAALTSVVFAAAHELNGGETLADIAGILMVALSLCLLLRASGSLWLGIGFHGALDWSQAYLFSLPDNGVSIQGHLLLTHLTKAASLSDGRSKPLLSLLMSLVISAGALLLAAFVRRFPRRDARKASAPEPG